MTAQYLLLAAIGLVFVAPICAFILGDAKRRHDAAQAYAAGFRAGQKAEFEAQARQWVTDCSFRLQAEQAPQQAIRDARQYRAQRGALG